MMMITMMRERMMIRTKKIWMMRMMMKISITMRMTVIRII